MHKMIALPILLLAAIPALCAYSGPGEAGFLAGLAHPLFGIDHLLAMVCVGVMAVRCSLPSGRSNNALWQVPATFMGAMLVGGLLAAGGMSMPLAEWGIAISVLVFGVVVAMAHTPKTWIACAVAGSFALLHGHAHLTELPGANPMASMSGVLVMTAALHALGMTLGWWIATTSRLPAVRFVGIARPLAA